MPQAGAPHRPSLWGHLLAAVPASAFCGEPRILPLDPGPHQAAVAQLPHPVGADRHRRPGFAVLAAQPVDLPIDHQGKALLVPGHLLTEAPALHGEFGDLVVDEAQPAAYVAQPVVEALRRRHLGHAVAHLVTPQLGGEAAEAGALGVGEVG